MASVSTPIPSGGSDDVAGTQTAGTPPLRVRRLGRVPYAEAHALQTALFDARVRGDAADYLLLLEHPHVITLGRRADPANLLLTADEYAAAGIDIVATNRGGDVTYHGPGQLVGYPILRLERPDVVAHVRNLEAIVIATLAEFGIDARREDGYTGVWTDAGKICAIGCRVTRAVTMHGFALNVDVDLANFGRIVPCGIGDRPVTSIAAILGDAAPDIDTVAERLIAHAAASFGRRAEIVADLRPAVTPAATTRSTPVKLTVRPGRSLRAQAVEAGPDVRSQARDRPDWLKRRANLAEPGFLELKALVRDLDLHTVCEEAQCPNIFDCWSERTATLMLLGDVCTRSCGFCDVATGKPPVYDPDEPARVAEAVARMGLRHAVLTSVARDDLPDGGADVFARSILAIRERLADCRIEVLVPEFKGDAAAAATLFAARPDVCNHNIETVARLQRLTRPQASYARSLAFLARAKAAGLTTKSGIICGMGETDDEVIDTMRDLRAVGVDIVTLGQYLRPSARHLPVDRWVPPATFDRFAAIGAELGFSHVESGPLVRSSYHAGQGAEAAHAAAAGANDARATPGTV